MRLGLLESMHFFLAIISYNLYNIITISKYVWLHHPNRASCQLWRRVAVLCTVAQNTIQASASPSKPLNSKPPLAIPQCLLLHPSTFCSVAFCIQLTPRRKDVAATNPRGIPYAPFVDKVEDYVTSRDDVEATLKQFQEMIA